MPSPTPPHTHRLNSSCLLTKQQQQNKANGEASWVTEHAQDGYLPLESESEVAQSCPTLCDPMDCSPPGSSVHVISQARVLEWVAISFSRGSSGPRDWTWVSHTAGRRFNLWATREPMPFNPLVLERLCSAPSLLGGKLISSKQALREWAMKGKGRKTESERTDLWISQRAQTLTPLKKDEGCQAVDGVLREKQGSDRG